MNKNRSKVISFRTTTDEFNYINNLAKFFGMKKSQLIFMLAGSKKFNHVVVRSPKDDAAMKDELGKFSTLASELISQWRHADDNINQIARALNVSLKSNGRVDFNELKRVTRLVADLHDSSYELRDHELKLAKGVTKLWHTVE